MPGRLALALVLLLAGPAGAQPTHAPVEEGPRPPEIVQGCGYYAILATAPDLDGAFAEQDRFGPGTGVLDTDEIAQFAGGQYVVVKGPFGTRALATARVDEAEAIASEPYVKFGCIDGFDDPRVRSDDPVTDAPPLLSGVYVREEIGCAAPPNAAFRVFDGRGLSGSASRDCRFTVETREGDLYGGPNLCTETYDGRKVAVALSLRVLDIDRFRLAEGGTLEGTFRLCPALGIDAFR